MPQPEWQGDDLAKVFREGPIARYGGSRALLGRGRAIRREGQVKIHAIHNYAENTRRGATLVEGPLAAPDTASVSEPDPSAGGKSARHYGVIAYSRGRAKAANRVGSPLAKMAAFGAIFLLISAAAYLGSTAYREVEHARSLNEGQDQRLAQLEEQISWNSQRLSALAQSNQDLLANLSLPTKLSNDFNNGVCLISGSYIFIDPETGLPLRGMKRLKDESDEVEQPKFTTGGHGEIAEVFYTGTGFHVGDGYLLTNRHVVVEPWKYDTLSYLFSKIISVQPRLVKLEVFFPGQRRSYQLTVKRASSRDDVAVCKLSGAEVSKEIPVLPLDLGAESAKIGQAVTTMGFPAGADRPMSILPEEEAKRLLEQYGEEGPSLLNQLARRNVVKPLTSQGHVMDLYEDRIVYDAASGEGSSGAPVFGPSGRVIGIHFGSFEQNRLSNYAVPIGRGLALLRQAGWKPAN
jgi:S1-C subfamily serine protease